MQSTPITPAVITGGCSIISAIIGVIAARSNFIEGLYNHRDILSLKGDWISKWVENGKEFRETLSITKVRGSRVFGIVTSESHPGIHCKIEGLFTGKHLQLLWFPSSNNRAKPYDDCGCYFFEKQGDGTFIGHATGFFTN